MNKGMAVDTDELESAARWVTERLLCADKLPYSFVYDGRRRAACEGKWTFTNASRKLDENRTEYVTELADPDTGLAVTCNIVLNQKYPAVEWTLWFENRGDADTPVLNDVRAVDTDVLPSAGDLSKRRSPAVKLYHWTGDYAARDGYEPREHLFLRDIPLTLRPLDGRPTSLAFPYYRIQGDDRGLIFVVSWQGQWETTFTPVGPRFHWKDGLHAVARQQFFHAKLHPGEKIRSPMIVLMPYAGTDGVRAQNLWRRWFLEFNQPRPNGEAIKPFMANYSGCIFHEMMDATEENQKQYVDLFHDHGIEFDYLWMDAGWYDTNGIRNWGILGTWKPDRRRFPNGIRAISDYARARGIRTMLWFEPERVTPDTELYREHPDWLLPLPGQSQGTKLLNLGNDAAREWLTGHINGLINSEDIDIYRQDFNLGPLVFWSANEPADRQGMLENGHCVGYLKFWDGLLAANPGLIIDSCASGGQRNDLETMRRALPLHKTDYNYRDLSAKQDMHFTLFQWLPFFGSMNQPADQNDIYYHRSALLLSYHCADNVFQEDYDFKKLAEWMEEWREVAPYLYGDFYPLTPPSRDERNWLGWQFHLPEQDAGIVQVFMRPQSPYRTAVFKLAALDSDATYELKDYDSGETRLLKGTELAEAGLEIVMNRQPDSALLRYCRR